MVLKERLAHRFHGSTRVVRGWYNPETRIIEVQFTDGVHWAFEDCTMQTWQNFIKSMSPGRFIFEILNRHPYHSA